MLKTVTQLPQLEQTSGVWAPTLRTDGINFDSVTYGSLTGGKWVKIGNIVHFQGFLITDAVTLGSANSYVQIGGLPFTASANTSGKSDGQVACSVAEVGAWASNMPSEGYIQSGTKNIYLLYRLLVNGASSLVVPSDVGLGGNANRIRVAGTYISA